MREIDGDELIEFIENRYDITWNDDYECGIKDACTDILEKISKMPTIEPERKKGKWIEQDDCWDGVYYECSVCKEPFTLIDGTPSDNLYNFCPNCGADMTNS